MRLNRPLYFVQNRFEKRWFVPRYIDSNMNILTISNLHYGTGIEFRNIQMTDVIAVLNELFNHLLRSINQQKAEGNFILEWLDTINN